MKKALIAMSDGVDSSLAAKLMKDAGYDCIDCNRYMKFDKLFERARMGTLFSAEAGLFKSSDIGRE